VALTRLLPALLVFIGAGCELPRRPCGWDAVIEPGSTYDVSLLERYTTDSMMAAYAEEHDLAVPAPTCTGLDDLHAGEVWGVRVLPPAADQFCSFYRGEITAPPIDIGESLPVVLNDRSHNFIATSGRWDFGAGCDGLWEFTVHAPSDEPFRTQTPEGTPIVVAYRVFEAVPENNAACSAIVGRPATSEGFRCGDAYVASMSPSRP
jgi:hypothetical protein